jgi:beta-lactamase regulating signal transducer with metallopeptidase domain
VTEHLLVSTVILALAMLAARVLPLKARTRYAVLLAGIMKFAIPTAVFRLLPIDVQTAPRIFGGDPARVPAPAERLDWLAIAWAAIATIVFARWLLLRTRTIAAALRAPSPASPRELVAVADARIALKLCIPIDVIRSPICEAPAMLRIVRPVIALPAHRCDDLSDGELRSLALHECAHVARHDNFAALLQSLATSLLWFHPLVWLASHALTIAREEACDETVADAMHQTDDYLSALTKIGHNLAAPRTAGVSCMASANIRERMEHLMSYETIQGKAWSHRMTVVVGLIVIAASTFAVAQPVLGKERPYSLTYTVSNEGTTYFVDMRVIENATGAVVFKPRLTSHAGIPVTIQTGTQGGPREFTIKGSVAEGGAADLTLEVQEDGKLVQRTLYTHDHKTYDGQPISIQLKDADLRDVLTTFGELTGIRFDVASDVSGIVTVDATDVPWDQMLEVILNQNNLIGELDGNTMHIRRK